MACKYHPDLPVKGQCSKCGADYCEICDFEMVKGEEHSHLCLDCAKDVALRRLIFSIVFAIGGFIWGTVTAKNLFSGLIYAYFMWGLYFGYSHQFWAGRYWQKLIKSAQSSKTWGLAFLIILLLFRIVASVIIGCFREGFIQTKTFIEIIKLQKELSNT